MSLTVYLSPLPPPEWQQPSSTSRLEIILLKRKIRQSLWEVQCFPMYSSWQLPCEDLSIYSLLPFHGFSSPPIFLPTMLQGGCSPISSLTDKIRLTIFDRPFFLLSSDHVSHGARNALQKQNTEDRFSKCTLVIKQCYFLAKCCILSVFSLC